MLRRKWFALSGSWKTKTMRKLSSRLQKDERGQGLAEYIIIVILVAIIVLVAVKFFGKSVFNQFENATNQIDTLQ